MAVVAPYDCSFGEVKLPISHTRFIKRDVYVVRVGFGVAQSS